MSCPVRWTGPDVEVLDEPVQVLGGGRAVVVAPARAGVAEAAQVDGERPGGVAASSGMSLWKAHQVSGNPWTSRIGDPVVPADDVVQLGPVDSAGGV